MRSAPLALPSSRGQRLALALLCALGLIALALAADSIVAARASAAPVRSGDRYTLSGHSVAIYNLAGEATLEPGTGSTVVVQVSRGGDDAERLDIETGEIGGRQTLRVVYPSDHIIYPPMGRGSNTETRVRDNGTFGDGKKDWGLTGHRVRISGSGTGLEAYADLRVSVPRGQELALRLACGAVTVRNVDGHLLVDTGSGAVTTSGTRGELDVDTGSGSVEVSEASGDLSIDTGSGEVKLSGFSDGSLSIDTGSGNIEARDVDTESLNFDTGSGDIEAWGIKAQSLRLDTGSGSVEVELLSDAQSLDIDTGSGDVVVHVPASFGADISFESGSGDFETTLPVTVREKDHGSFRGKLRDGSGRLVVETGSGDLKLVAVGGRR